MLGQSRLVLASGLVSLSLACGSPFQGLEARDPDREPESTEAVRDVTASDYLPRVDLLAVGYADGRFEVRSPTPHHVLSRGKHQARIARLAISPSGRYLASADTVGHVAVSEIESGSYGLLPKLPRTGDEPLAVGLAWDAAGKRLAIVAGSELRVVEPESGASTRRSLREPASAVTFTRDQGRLLVAGTRLAFVDLPSLETTMQVFPGRPVGANDNEPALDIRYSPDGQCLGVLYPDSVVLAPRTEELLAAPISVPAVGLRFASDGRVAIFGRNALYVGPPNVIDVSMGLRKTAGELWDVEFREDGSLMFLGDTADAELASVGE